MTANQVIELARSQVGVTEYPPNSNNVIYNTWYYGHPVSGSAYPWCCVFIEWLFKAEPNLLKRTASCSDLLRWCQSQGMIVDKPQVGDIVFFNFNNPSVLAQHIGIIDKPKVAKDIYSIEGNTSEKGSQDNGGAVLRKHRTGKCIVAYARPKYSNTTTSPTTITTTIPQYHIGQTYTTTVELFIRTAPMGEKKPFDLITKNAKQHSYKDSEGYAVLKKNTRVTCQGVDNKGKDIWIKIPSGWIAAYYKGKKYVE